jgi:hypothetical protein
MSVFNPVLTTAEARRSHTHCKTLATGVINMFSSRFFAETGFNDFITINQLHFGH